jgi:hypothetical protein
MRQVLASPDTGLVRERKYRGVTVSQHGLSAIPGISMVDEYGMRGCVPPHGTRK